jgi:uncharacterized protein (TIGR00730 family)
VTAKVPPPIPRPPHPRDRREPLPWQAPKGPHEDARAPEKIERIVRSASYRRADEDPDFLRLDETRGIRLQIEYQKPQLLLERHGIRHTIVVFGGTRIVEASEARRRLETLRSELEARPNDAELRLRVARTERILARSSYYDAARELGRLVAESGDGPADSRLVVLTGGGPGLMEAANRGAHDAGALTVGLNIDLPHEQYPNPYVTPELCFRFHYFALRKLHFLLRAKALVAFPGGFGTLDELFETLTLVQTRKIEPIPIVLVGESYWKRLVDIDFLVDEGAIDAEDRELLWYAETAEEVWTGIRAWYESNGRSLLETG